MEDQSNKGKVMNIRFPKEVREMLGTMSQETGISMSDLVRMATHSMVVNYETKGSFIFADLINPEYKSK